ncbi:tetratricopeptide repeat protein [Alloacidobacterium sp.]|uniref:tetratricopeptide repeat protein n=1 Tax=Alloacidobacterium sp. TaxID=2951999 RepID=UPI002D48C403|nr:tetratricopeptide repeat protein [Alloacidobacterium sp.]HYK36173.1 tetratricopeptide repeat protein [Alloacidobacterium sp.]
MATLALAAACCQPTFAQSKAPAPTTDQTTQKPDRSAAYYHYTLAHEYEEMATTYGRPDYATRAIEEYKLALNADPDSPYLNAHLAELYFQTGRVRDAIAAAQEEIKKNPNNLEAHKLLGRIYLRSLGNMQNGGPSDQMMKLAIDEYARIVQLEPNDTENRLLLGRLYTLNHDSAHAEEQFKAAQKIDPDSEDVVLNIAGLYSEQGDNKRAIEVLKALPDDDQTPKTLYALGQTYDQLKDTKNALDAYQKAFDLEPDNLDVERALGQAQLNAGQDDAALKSFKDVAAGDTSDPQALLRIAEIERRQGKYEDALATLKKAKDLVSDSLEINFNEALTYDALGQYDQASQILEKLVSDSEHVTGQYTDGEKNNRAIFLERLANVYREQGKTDLAVGAYQKMADMGGDYTLRGYQNIVDAYRDAHEYDKATAAARDAVAKTAKDKDANRDAKLMLASQLTDTGKVDEGIDMAKGMLNGASPADQRTVELRLAEMYTRLKRWKDAGDAIDKADTLSTKPDDKIYTYFLRGALEERQKHYDEAEAQFRKLLSIDPNNALTLNYLGYMLADRGVRLNEALTMIKKAVELDPQNYAYLDSLGWAYYKMGQYTPAEENLTKAVARNSTDPTVHDHLGELYEKTNRLKLAAAQWEQSLNEYAKTVSADADPGDVGKVQKKLDSARVRLAKESSGALANTSKQ